MAQRKRIALRYAYNEGWIGGTYYLHNLISSLKLLDEKEMPHLRIYAHERDFSHLRALGYPHMTLENIEIRYNFPERAVNKLWRILTGKNFLEKRPNPRNSDFLFPIHHDDFAEAMPENRTIYWIADFQDRHMPELFSERELEMRRRKQSFIASRRAHIIFSSETALHDFTTFYPEYCCQTYVVPFTVTHPSLEGIIQEDLVKKYDLSPRYFFLPNQFWKHKNHILVLQALKIMQERGLTTQVVFTGKEEDYRNPEHFTSLQNYVKENQLFDHVRFLGFIDRAEQLVLMKNSFAVIQPSLFEGWSTVVEDAKALNCFVLLSDIPVHREQMKENARFFSPYDAEGLAKLMSEVWENPPHVSHTPYDCGRFGQLFYSVLRRAESRL